MTPTSTIIKRLNREHRSRKYPHTWRAIAARRHVNVRYVYNLAIHGVEPTNNIIRAALGLRRRKPPNPPRLIPLWLDEAVANLELLLKKKGS